MRFLKLLFVFAVVFLCNGCGLNKRVGNLNLLRECPDEKIVYKENVPGSKTAKEYYMYKGRRYEIWQFDGDWLEKNCKMRLTLYY